jgi:hypothetical protein
MDSMELADVTVPSAVVVAPRVMWYRLSIASLSCVPNLERGGQDDFASTQS